MHEVRWGIIGCGDVTEVKSGPGFQKADRSRLVAVMRRNGALAEDYAKRHGVAKWYDDAEALIRDPEVDAVYIATPPAYHKPYTLAAARAGKPVYVEKPMALTFAECEEMIQACGSAAVPLFVAYYRRALPRFLKIKALLESGAIGDVRFAATTQHRPPHANETDRGSLSWRVQPQLAGGGLFFDLASHTLDILDFLLGPISEAKGIASNQGGLYEAEDMVSGTYRFASGAHGMGSWCFTAYSNVDKNEIVGTKGKLEFSTFGSEPVVLITAESREEFAFDRPVHIQQHLIQTIVDELTGQGRCPSKGETAARTSKVIDEMVKGYYYKA